VAKSDHKQKAAQLAAKLDEYALSSVSIVSLELALISELTFTPSEGRPQRVLMSVSRETAPDLFDFLDQLEGGDNG